MPVSRERIWSRTAIGRFLGANPPPRARVDSEGKFLLSPLAAGTYELYLHHSPQALGRDPGLWKPRSPTVPPLGLVTLPGPQRIAVEFDLTQQRRSLIQCQTSVDGEPAVGWRVEAHCESEEGLELHRTETRTGPGGVAHLPQLLPGTWKLALLDNDGLWRAWAKEPLVLAPGAEVTVSIEVALHPGQLLVLDASTDQPRRNQTVLFEQGAQQGSVKTDADGKLNLRLPLGSYGLRAGSISGSPEAFLLQLGKPSSPLEWTPSGPQPAAIRL